MKNIPLLIGTILGSILMIVVIAFFFSESGQVGQDQMMYPAEQVAGEVRHVKGASESAKVQIVEYSDFECPACRAAQTSISLMMEQYSDQVQLIYKHFPLDSIHPNARDAAIASELAAQSNKFWEMHDLLFDKQDEWSSITDKNQLYEKFSEYAQQIQIDKNDFLSKIKDNQEIRDLVQKDSQLANELKLSGTPTFFVNGKQTTAPQLLETVSAVLQPEQQ